MLRGTPNHNTISGNVFAGLRSKPRGAACRPFNSDQWIRVSAFGLSTYPDASMVCGELDSLDNYAVVNHRVTFEVSAKSSESSGRGRRFDFYRRIETLRENALISQDEYHVESFIRQPNRDWLLSFRKGLDARLRLSSIELC